MLKKRIFASDLVTLRPYSNTSIVEVGAITQFIEILSDVPTQSFHQIIEDGSMSEEQLKAFTGLTWANVIELREMLVSMRDSSVRSVTQALIIFLFRLRTANSSEVTATLFGISQQ
jgi:hypothetical protein